MRFFAIAAIWLAAAVVPVCGALTLDFYNITNTSSVNALAGENQLFVDVLGVGDANLFNFPLVDTQVLFQFRNEGPAASSITQIYFEDGALLDVAEVISSDGVDFSPWLAPNGIPSPSLPGGTSYNFDPTSSFTVVPGPPRQPNGVNPDEYFGVVFKLQERLVYSDVLAALAIPDDEENDRQGSLRIGFHVQGFGDGGSESFINNPPDEEQAIPGVNHAPEAGSLAVWSFLAVSSLAFVGYRRRRGAR